MNNKDDKTQAKTYIYYRKYIADMVNQQRSSWVNWIIFRYADVLLIYAEAKNEATGKDYVWPLPQTAIDNATKLVQHIEWK
ncbi:MAG: RagB/SusD family nutrient uptake outer membrane protein [Rudanella sp.]|nr:RagB/SusD family nutrient uptake outer membrane protein [Rudanella sp.]